DSRSRRRVARAGRTGAAMSRCRQGFRERRHHSAELSPRNSLLLLQATEELTGEERGLETGDLVEALLGERDQAGELLLRKRGFLAGALDLDEAAAAGHDDVEVHLRVLVLDVREVEQFASAEHAH